jgi:hypothetical protein
LQWFSILWQTSHKEKDGDNGCEIDNQDLKRNVKRCRRWCGNWERKFIDDEGGKKEQAKPVAG